MLPTVMLSAVLSLSPPQPILIPSDMLRFDLSKPPPRIKFPKLKLEDFINIDADLKLYEQLLERAKKEKEPQDYIDLLQKLVDQTRQLKAESGKGDDQPDLKFYEQLVERAKKDGLPQDFIKELQKMLERVREKKD